MITKFQWVFFTRSPWMKYLELFGVKTTLWCHRSPETKPRLNVTSHIKLAIEVGKRLIPGIKNEINMILTKKNGIQRSRDYDKNNYSRDRNSGSNIQPVRLKEDSGRKQRENWASRGMNWSTPDNPPEENNGILRQTNNNSSQGNHSSSSSRKRIQDCRHCKRNSHVFNDCEACFNCLRVHHFQQCRTPRANHEN